MISHSDLAPGLQVDASSFAAVTDWLHDFDESGRIRLGFGDGVPAGTTMWRLLIRLDPTLLTSILADWLHSRTRQPDLPPRRHRRRVLTCFYQALLAH